eukprot:Opistho-2@18754
MAAIIACGVGMGCRSNVLRAIAIAFLISLVVSGTHAVDCGSISFTVSSSTGSLPSGCTRIIGDVYVSVDGVTQLPTASFGTINSISGSLRVTGCRDLTSLVGFNSLQTVGWLDVSSNPALVSLQGLNSLRTVDGNLTLSANVALTSIDGLGSLVSVGKTLTIATNIKLPNVDPLSSLTTVGSLSVSSNTALVNVDGLRRLTLVVANATIAGNNALVDINGLCLLARVGGNLAIRSNLKLGSLDGLVSLREIGSNLFVEKNAILLTIDALRSVRTINGSVSVQQNTKLCYDSDVDFANIAKNGVVVASNRLPDDPCASPRPVPNWPANGRSPSVAVVQARSLPIQWIPAANDNGLVFKYEVLSNSTVIGTLDMFATNTSSTLAKFSPADNPIQFTISGLVPFTTYFLAVRAYNLAGSKLSEYATVRTYSDIPEGVASPSVSVVDARTVQVSWSLPNITNGPIVSYVIRRDGIVAFEGTSLAFRDAGLDPFTTYSYTVEAKTVAGGRESAPAVVKTKEDKPFQVRAPTVTPLSTTKLRISWPNPGQPNGNITKYEVYLVRGNTRTLMYTGTGNTFDLTTGLAANTQYSFLLVASTSQGSTESQQSSGRTPITDSDGSPATVASPAVFVALVALLCALSLVLH